MVLDAAPTGMIMVDAQGRIVLVNRHVELLFDYERDLRQCQALGLDLVFHAPIHPDEVRP